MAPSLRKSTVTLGLTVRQQLEPIITKYYFKNNLIFQHAWGKVHYLS